MKVICINSQDRPDSIPLNEWIEEGEIYTIKEIARMGLQHGALGYKLKEVELSEGSFPYEYYNADRFMFLEELFQNGQMLKETERDYSSEDADLEMI
jgi:hypothetical protein